MDLCSLVSNILYAGNAIKGPPLTFSTILEIELYLIIFLIVEKKKIILQNPRQIYSYFYFLSSNTVEFKSWTLIFLLS